MLICDMLSVRSKNRLICFTIITWKIITILVYLPAEREARDMLLLHADAGAGRLRDG